jgi:ribonuclease D
LPHFTLHDAVAELLTTPPDGLPAVIQTPEHFRDALDQLRKGGGPFAVDAERASGYRYSARAYLIQIKRRNGGLHLIDPIPFGPHHELFLELNEMWQGEEVILHASTQDLPCLRELGLNPSLLFDTELAGRLVGLPRVGLGALVESLLDVALAKEHSAQDWSIRPLPEDWLNYAALDVELLIELRDEIEKLLIENKKLKWAEQEFAAILKAPPHPPRIDPWRRTSGSHKVKKRHQLAVVRELWIARDELAREADISQGRLLSDAAITALALASESAPLTTKKQLEKVLRPIGLRARWMESAPTWIAAIASALSLTEDQCPPMKIKGDSLPPVKIWRDRFPERYAPLSHARAGTVAAAAELNLPVENLMTPELIRRACWNLPQGEHQLSEIQGLLQEWGARDWQIDVVAPILQAALRQSEPLPEPEVEATEENPES